MTDENARKAILARRARFIAAATLSAGMVSCGDVANSPTVCLSIAMPPPTDTPPGPCLSVAPTPPTPPDGTGTSATDGGAPGAPDAGAGPQPCLKVRPPPPPPPPQVCLSPRRPPPKDR
jgi:hypothetical protein